MKYDFLILGFGESSGSWTNPQWMAYTLSEQGYNVAYYNPPAYRKIKPYDSVRIVKRIFAKNDKSNNVNFDVFNCYSSDQFPLNILNNFEKRKTKKLVEFSSNVICFQPLWLKFFDLPKSKTSYVICDDYAALKNSSANQTFYDQLVNKHYKNIMVTNEKLINKHPNAFFYPNCISKNHFNNSNDELAKSKIEKQVCFVGALHSEKINLKLIFKLIDSNKNYNFIFAGKLFGIDIKDLPKSSNFDYLGEIPFTQASKLMKNSEYGLIPFVRNEYTDSIFSMKYFEYIASLTNPVCTNISMFKSIPKNLAPQIFLDKNLNLDDFKMHSLQSMRKIVLKEYTYSSRIKKMFDLNYFVS